MLKEFRDFLFQGNVIALAIAVVIGVAFGAVVTSFTTDVLSPLLGLLGIPDLSTWSYTTPGGAIVAYGKFLNSIINFIIVALAIFFFVVKPANALEKRRKAAEAANPATKTCPECATEIPVAAKRCPNCGQLLTA